MTSEAKLRDLVCRTGASLFNRGLTHGSTGNISVALTDGGWLMTPTGSSLGTLDPARLSKLDASGRLLDGDKPTKEAFLHTCMYRERPKAGAVVHLHSTHSVAVSCLEGIDHAPSLVRECPSTRFHESFFSPYRVAPSGDCRSANRVRY